MNSKLDPLGRTVRRGRKRGEEVGENRRGRNLCPHAKSKRKVGTPESKGATRDQKNGIEASRGAPGPDLRYVSKKKWSAAVERPKTK